MAMYVFVLPLLALVSSGTEIDLVLDPKNYIYKLTPTDFAKTTWNLKTDEGGKISIFCELLVKDCSKVKFQVGFKGQSQTTFCDDEVKELNNAVSIRNEISLTISSKVNEVPAYCNATGSQGYLNLPEVEYDSDEEGVEIDKKPTCECGWSNREHSRIVGGREAYENEIPFVVALAEVGDRPKCGGSILTPYHVLTAAHCYNESVPMDKYRVIVGAHNINENKYNQHTKVMKAEKLMIHEKYSFGDIRNDLAIVYLKEPIKFTEFVGPVCMPRKRAELVDGLLKVMGWGFNGWKYPDVLYAVRLRVVDNNVCKAVFHRTDMNTNLCTYTKSKDSCQGDSGGPLVKVNPETNMYTQYGMVSFGFGCATTNPGISTDVFAYMDWIKDRIKESKNHEMCYS